MASVGQVCTMATKAVNRLVSSVENKGYCFVSELKSYDARTYQHSLNVAGLSLAIGKEMRLKTEKLEQLGLCALLHDIGKTRLPISLINKTNPLTDNEYKVIKTHSEQGGNYLKEKNLQDADILSGVLHHHEKFNGSGYPSGLMGDRIPLFSRIISIADVYDAVTSARPYRKPVPASEALDLIIFEVGHAFDYEIYKVLPTVVNPNKPNEFF